MILENPIVNNLIFFSCFMEGTLNSKEKSEEGLRKYRYLTFQILVINMTDILNSST